MRAVYYAVTNVLMLLFFLLGEALAHGQQFTQEENDWMERQNAVDGTKCCDRHDVHFLDSPNWRMKNAGYEVLVEGKWHEVPPGRTRAINPEDPSPFGDGQALLFYSVHSDVVYIWCFTPSTLG